jgi:hypothetical protein
VELGSGQLDKIGKAADGNVLSVWGRDAGRRWLQSLDKMISKADSEYMSRELTSKMLQDITIKNPKL